MAKKQQVVMVIKTYVDGQLVKEQSKVVSPKSNSWIFWVTMVLSIPFWLWVLSLIEGG